MPIKQLRNDSIAQRCAKCGADRNINYSDLELGIEIDSEADVRDNNVIALPPCGECGAKEFLLRNWDKSNEPATSTKLLHRKAVNRLAKNLKEIGRVNPACEQEIRAEDKDPPDMMVVDINDKGIDIIKDQNRQVSTEERTEV